MPAPPETTRQLMPSSPCLEALRAAHSRLREDFDALCTCLEKQGVLKQSWLCADKPKAEAGPDGLVRSLLDVLEPKVLSGVLRYCGAAAWSGGRAEMLALKATASVAKAEKVYAFGGIQVTLGSVTKTAECFDPRRGKWDPVAPMFFSRAGCTAGVLGGRVHICGGAGETGRLMETFNPKLQAWDTPRPAFELSVVRMFAAVAVVGGRLYVSGGVDKDRAIHSVHRSVEFYEPGPVGGKPRGGMLPEVMQQPRRSHGMAAMPGEGVILMVAGGSASMMKDMSVGNPKSVTIYSSAEVLDLSGGGWQHVAPLLQPRVGVSLSTCRGRLYAIGGTSDFITSCGSMECWHPQAGCWSTIAAPGLVGDHSCVPAGGGIYVLGGIRSVKRGTPATRRSRLFSPETGEWEDLPLMLYARSAFGSACVKLAALAF